MKICKVLTEILQKGLSGYSFGDDLVEAVRSDDTLQTEIGLAFINYFEELSEEKQKEIIDAIEMTDGEFCEVVK